MSSQSSSWNAANESTVKVEALEIKYLEYEAEYETCGKNIQFWKEEIEKLNEKIRDVEDRQVEILKIDKHEIDEEVQKGIQYIEKAQ